MNSLNFNEVTIFADLKSLKARELVLVHKIMNGNIDCQEFQQKNGLKIPSFNYRKNPPYALSKYNKNYVSNTRCFAYQLNVID